MVAKNFDLPSFSRSSEAYSNIRTAAEYELLLNAEESLPNVSLSEQWTENSQSSRQKSIHFHIINHDEKVGELTILTPAQLGSNSKAYINLIEVTSEQRGRGFGRAAYKELIKYLADRKILLISNDIHEAGKYHSKAIWDWLVSLKVARRTSDDYRKRGAYEII